MATEAGVRQPRIVIFEDHTWQGLRPLADAVPVFELRCGLFNLRERAVLAGGAGALLCRPHLAPLVADDRWQVGSEGPRAPRELWLAGRLAPDPALVALLLEAAVDGTAFAWQDAEGLVAASLAAAEAAAAAQAWADWANGRAPRFDLPGGLVPSSPGASAGPPGAPAGQGARLAAAGMADALRARLEVALTRRPALRRPWDLVPATAQALADDLAAGLAAGGWDRRPYGLFAADGTAASWSGRSRPQRRPAADLPAGTWLLGDDLWCADGVTLAPGAVLDTRRGPVVLDLGCDIAPHTLLEGPLYLGPACRVKAGARLYGETSLGIGCRVAGEIGESTFGDFTNKQHEGFIGHAALGSWVNLGALTTCSDLKNNYGNVKVDLGGGLEETGQRFVGLLAGDHVKTAIGTLFNTGTVVGFASNIFGTGMPPKYVPPFSWGGRAGDPPYGLQEAVATARVVLGRRGCRLLPAHEQVFAALSRG